MTSILFGLFSLVVDVASLILPILIIGRVAMWVVFDVFSFNKMLVVLLAGTVFWAVFYNIFLGLDLTVPYRSGGVFENMPFWIYFFGSIFISNIMSARFVKLYETRKHAMD